MNRIEIAQKIANFSMNRRNFYYNHQRSITDSDENLLEIKLKLIFIHGPAAVGKLTVARQLQELTGYRLFHNHLVVDTLLSVFPFGSPSFIRLRERMWTDVFCEAVRDDISLIFTFTPEPSVRPGFVKDMELTVSCRGGQVHYVKLVCPPEEQERRIVLPSRTEFLKIKSLEKFRELRRNQTGFVDRLKADLVIDTGLHTPEEASRSIIDEFELPAVQEIRLAAQFSMK